jgi:hypothetical protein
MYLEITALSPRITVHRSRFLLTILDANNETVKVLNIF